MPTLEQVLTKEVSDLTEEEKTLLTENQDKLDASQKQKYGLEASPVAASQVKTKTDVKEDDKVTDTIDKETAAIAASVKSGESVVIKASDLKQLQDSAKDYQTEKARQVVTAHIARGAVKADAEDKWVAQVLANREAAEELLKSIPDNQLLASEKGSEAADEAIDERERITTLASSKVKAAQAEGKTLDIKTAMTLATDEIKASQAN